MASGPLGFGVRDVLKNKIDSVRGKPVENKDSILGNVKERIHSVKDGIHGSRVGRRTKR